VLLVFSATAEGKKELMAIGDGYRESEASWKEVLLDLKAGGLKVDPKLAIGDGMDPYSRTCIDNLLTSHEKVR
jgi:transposase-like protein